MTVRVALTRPIEDASRSASLLRARGFEPVLAPVMEIVSTGGDPPDGDYDAVLATSANAFAFLSAEARARLRELKLHVAGERTAGAAGAAGFGAPETTGADASALASSLAARSPPLRFLYLAGRHRKPDLESALRAAGHRIVAAEVYEARAREDWSADEAQALSACEAVLHYSRRSAELAAVLAARAGLGDLWRAMAHACLSADVAEPLRLRGAGRILVAAGAQEHLLFEALARRSTPAASV